jgi:citrate lyase beta subunit
MALRCTVALFVPADRPERFSKAVASGADIVLLDLEDAVAPGRKDAARRYVVEALAAGLQAWVRINSPRSDAGLRDVAALANVPAAGVMIAKTASAADVAAVRSSLGDAAAARGPLCDAALIALIESIDGLRNIDAIAEGVEALAFGGYDLCAELGARPVPEVLAPLRSRVVLAARAAGIAAIDTPFIALDDEAGLADDARRAVDFGFDGKLAIHPKHVAAIKKAFTPDPVEVDRARAILAAAHNGGVAVVDGTMVDAPLVRAAERVIARAEHA